jgi:hypothetical protein
LVVHHCDRTIVRSSGVSASLEPTNIVLQNEARLGAPDTLHRY